MSVSTDFKHLFLCLGPIQNSALPPAQVANVSGVSPVLSANTNPASPRPPQSQDAPKTPLKYKPLGPVQNMSNVQSQPKTNSENNHPPQ